MSLKNIEVVITDGDYSQTLKQLDNESTRHFVERVENSLKEMLKEDIKNDAITQNTPYWGHSDYSKP